MCSLDNTEVCCLVDLEKFKLDSMNFMRTTSVFIRLEGVLQVFCIDIYIYFKQLYTSIYKDVILWLE